MKLSLSSFSDRTCDSTDTNGEDTSSSSEEEKEREGMGQTDQAGEDHRQSLHSKGRWLREALAIPHHYAVSESRLPN